MEALVLTRKGLVRYQTVGAAQNQAALPPIFNVSSVTCEIEHLSRRLHNYKLFQDFH